ncbi:unnamed protein product [Dicrocoelium dendriticum]|nr:unnamed protein product [Dicrocoelium dendriticum]
MYPGRLSDGSAREQKTQQIKSWAGSETDRASSEYRPAKKIKFPLGVALIAACYANDQEEFKRILSLGIDINTRNPDGLTCVHQCCINGDYEFLEFLIKEGANINIQDNEGWTPLHAAASVGCEELVRLLLDNGADLSLLSCEMELASDVSQNPKVTELLNEAMHARGIDPLKARQAEELMLLQDVEHWMRQGKYEPVVDPLSGATPLHVAACKPYPEVLKMLLKIPGVDINAQDNDGWTPLHAAAHWNREESARLLVEAGASFDVCTYSERRLAEARIPATAPTPVVKATPVASPASDEESSDEEVLDDSLVENFVPDTALVNGKPELAELGLPTKVAAGDSDVSAKLLSESTPLDIAQMQDISHKPTIPVASSLVSNTAAPPVITPPPIAHTSPSTPGPVAHLPDVDAQTTVPSPLPPKDQTLRPTVDDLAPCDFVPTSTDAPKSTYLISAGSGELHTTLSEDKRSQLPNGIAVAENASSSSSSTPEESPVAKSTALIPDADVAVELSGLTRLRRSLREHSPTATVAPTSPAKTTTVNSARIVTIRRRQPPPGTVSRAPATTSLGQQDDKQARERRSPSPVPSDQSLNNRRVSLLMSPAKSGETETQRSVKARYVRSTRRSTQGVSAEEVEEAKKLIDNNNSASASISTCISSTSLTPECNVSNSSPHRSDKLTIRVSRFKLRSNTSPDSTLPDVALPTASTTVDGPPSSNQTTTLSRTYRAVRRSNTEHSSAPQDSWTSSADFTFNNVSGSRITNAVLRTQPRIMRDLSTDDTLKDSSTRSGRNGTQRFGMGAVLPSSFSSSSVATPRQPNTFNSSEDSGQIKGVISRPSSRFFHRSENHPAWSQANHLPTGSSYSAQPSRNGNVATSNYGSGAALPNVSCNSTSSLPVSSDHRVNTRGDPSSRYDSTKPIDYRQLYEKERAERERLTRELELLTRETASLRLQLSRITKDDAYALHNNATAFTQNTSQSTTEELHNRLLMHEDQLKELNRLREENAKMKEDNGALIRVISKLSKPI